MHNIEAFGDKVRTEVGQIKINNRCHERNKWLKLS